MQDTSHGDWDTLWRAGVEPISRPQDKFRSGCLRQVKAVALLRARVTQGDGDRTSIQNAYFFQFDIQQL